MDIYLTASQFGKYPGLATSTSVNNCYILNTYTICFGVSNCVAPVLLDVGGSIEEKRISILSTEQISEQKQS